MLIGAHVRASGGLVASYERGVESGSDAIQIFNQSPRAWRPTTYAPDDVLRFRELLAEGPVREVAIHAVYLINLASREKEIRSKSLAAMEHALRAGDAIGACGVVVHPGSRRGRPPRESARRVAAGVRSALRGSERCPVLLENTAGAGETIGRTFEELAELIDLLDGDERVGVCLDCCHLLASGYDVRDAERLAVVVDEFDSVVGLDRLRCLHVNDSQVPLGSNVDRHANVGEGELGAEGIGAFLSEPRFEDLPALIETAGKDGRGPDAAEVARAKELREAGMKARRGARGGRGGRTRRGRPGPRRGTPG